MSLRVDPYQVCTENSHQGGHDRHDEGGIILCDTDDNPAYASDRDIERECSQMRCESAFIPR